MDEICIVIRRTNEIGAKLTRWIIITDYANLIAMVASTGAFLILNTRIKYGFPRATAGEIFASRDDVRILHKCAQQMILQLFRHRY